MKILNRLTSKNPPCPPLRKGVFDVGVSLDLRKTKVRNKDAAFPITPFCKGGQGGLLLLLLLLLLLSCKYSFSEDKLSKAATAFNLAKPQSEKQARIIIQCDPDTPTGVRSIRGTVMDYDSSAPIQNAFVSTTVSTEVYATDTEGKFKIQKIGMETTKVTLKVTANTYKSLAAPIEFTCQNLNALVYLPVDTSIPASSATCIFAKSVYGGCKL